MLKLKLFCMVEDYAAHAAFIKEIWVELKKVNQQKKKSRNLTDGEEKRPRRARSRRLKGMRIKRCNDKTE